MGEQKARLAVARVAMELAGLPGRALPHGSQPREETPCGRAEHGPSGQARGLHPAGPPPRPLWGAASRPTMWTSFSARSLGPPPNTFRAREAHLLRAGSVAPGPSTRPTRGGPQGNLLREEWAPKPSRGGPRSPQGQRREASEQGPANLSWFGSWELPAAAAPPRPWGRAQAVPRSRGHRPPQAYADRTAWM